MKRESGFGLVEVLIALVLLVIALLAIASTFIMSSKLMSHSIDREKAVLVASEQMELLEAMDYESELVSSNDQIGTYDLQWDVVSDSDDIAKTVTLTVTWDGIGENNEVILTRSISRFASSTVEN
jgi:Tfp pilus assembly protein PilV